MPRSSRDILRVVVAAAAVAVALGLLAAYALWIHRGRLEALFAEPGEEVKELPAGFYAGIEYDLNGYRPASTDNEPSPAPAGGSHLLDRPKSEEDWERAIEGVHAAWKLDATTGATRISRLVSPTVYRARREPKSLTLLYPSEGAVFPPNLCSPTVEWADAHNDLWLVTLTAADNSASWSALSTERSWQIPDAAWRTLTRSAGAARIVVKGVRRSGLWGRSGPVQRSAAVSFSVSTDPADDAIVYRLVAPPYNARKSPDIYVREISRRRPRLLLEGHRTYCFNCHSFSSKSGDHGALALQVRYLGAEHREPRTYLALYDLDARRGRKIIPPLENQMSTFMGWSPDGTKLAVAVNQEFRMRDGPVVYETQSIGMNSDLAVWDLRKGTSVLLPGACAPGVTETYPCWTPDAKSIVYSSAGTGKHFSLTRFDLMRVPYNDGLGGTPVPVPAASRNGKSNFFPRFSPDGRWFTWVEADHDSLIKASSDIWIMPGDLGGAAHALECNVPYAADSWHSWSSNSRWIVFATKRDDGIFARLYLTHIDDAGRASPAVRLPIEDPGICLTFNIPEFVRRAPTVSAGDLYEGVGIHAEGLPLE